MQNVPVAWLQENAWNPNVMAPEKLEDLKKDVVAGDYNPVVVTPQNIYYGDPGFPSDQYIIVDGEHRWLAAVEAEVGYIDVDVRQMTEAEAKAYCYRRNSVKGTIDPVKEGEFFNLEVEELGSEAAVAERYGRSRSFVASRRALTRVAEPVKELLREPEKGFVAIKKAELAADIVESNPEEEYTEDQVTEMVDSALEEQEIVPRGTITASHVEAIVGLPEDVQTQVAAKIVEENLTVRDTETVVKLVKERIERKVRFEAALERAVQKTCPECGAPPKGFDSGYAWIDGQQTDTYDEERFECSKTGYHDWPFMKRAVAKEKQLEKERKERSKKLSAARLNPAYIRRAEEAGDLFDSMMDWVLRKIFQLKTVTRVSISGVRVDGKVMRIDYPHGYGSSLYFQTSDPPKEGIVSVARRAFSFSLEKKEYKTLPFKSKLNCTASPEYRALVNYFLDTIINTDLDPVLPEDSDQVRNILRNYGELPEEDEPHEEPEAEEAEETEGPLPLEGILSAFDVILDSFLEGEDDLVRVDVEGFDAEDIEGYLDLRIIARAITGNVEVYEGEDGGVYLERLGAEIQEES